MSTYLITHPDRPAAQIRTAGNSVLEVLTEIGGLPRDFAPVSRHAHSDTWNEIVDAYQGAPGNGYTVTLEALLTLTDFENAPIGTTVSHRHFATFHTKRGPNQWQHRPDGATISDEYMAQRGVAYTV